MTRLSMFLTAFALMLTPGLAIAQVNPTLPAVKSSDGRITYHAQPTQIVGNDGKLIVPAKDGGKVDTVIAAVSTDRGGIFGTTSAQLMPANAARRGYTIQVQGGTGSCYVSGLATATADYHSLQILAGAAPFVTPPTHIATGAISIICSAASIPVYAREW